MLLCRAAEHAACRHGDGAGAGIQPGTRRCPPEGQSHPPFGWWSPFLTDAGGAADTRSIVSGTSAESSSNTSFFNRIQGSGKCEMKEAAVEGEEGREDCTGLLPFPTPRDSPTVVVGSPRGLTKIPQACVCGSLPKVTPGLCKGSRGAYSTPGKPGQGFLVG